jgi:hypothetical protein
MFAEVCGHQFLERGHFFAEAHRNKGGSRRVAASLNAFAPKALH